MSRLSIGSICGFTWASTIMAMVNLEEVNALVGFCQSDFYDADFDNFQLPKSCSVCTRLISFLFNEELKQLVDEHFKTSPQLTQEELKDFVKLIALNNAAFFGKTALHASLILGLNFAYSYGLSYIPWNARFVEHTLSVIQIAVTSVEAWRMLRPHLLKNSDKFSDHTTEILKLIHYVFNDIESKIKNNSVHKNYLISDLSILISSISPEKNNELISKTMQARAQRLKEINANIFDKDFYHKLLEKSSGCAKERHSYALLFKSWFNFSLDALEY